MGVKGLNQLIKEHSPSAYKEFQLKNLFGRKVAIDASMCLYQFLIAVRQSDGQQLTNEDGKPLHICLVCFTVPSKWLKITLNQYMFRWETTCIKRRRVRKEIIA